MSHNPPGINLNAVVFPNRFKLIPAMEVSKPEKWRSTEHAVAVSIEGKLKVDGDWGGLELKDGGKKH